MENNSSLVSRMIGVLLLCQFLVSVGFVYYVFTENSKPQLPPLNVLRLVNPQPVLNKQLKQTELLRVDGTKCNLTNEPFSVDGVSYLVQESPVYWRYLRTDNKGVLRQPGCKTILYANDLRLGVPDSVTLEPGVYHLEGTETVRIGDQVQYAPWFTESFEIIE